MLIFYQVGSCSRSVLSEESVMRAIKLGKNAQIAIPRAVMKRLNLKGDETLLLEVSDDGVIRLRPAAVLPIEMYSDARISEFESESTVDEETRNRVRTRLRDAAGSSRSQQTAIASCCLRLRL
jgi:AbrB family looped-hinge helix DNA binding protein